MERGGAGGCRWERDVVLPRPWELRGWWNGRWEAVKGVYREENLCVAAVRDPRGEGGIGWGCGRRGEKAFRDLSIFTLPIPTFV